MQKQNELIEAGRLVVIGKYYDGACDTINYTDRTTGKPATIKQLKLTVGLVTPLVSAVMRVQEGEDPEAILKNLNLKEGTSVVMDVDSLTKMPPSAKGADPTWMLRIFGAYPAQA